MYLCQMPHSPDIAQNSDGVFLTSGFLVKFLISKNDLTAEPLMILTWNLGQQLNLTGETLPFSN